jgi:DNA-directed RNA polymerase subunit N (RpoN/RPB10)
MARPGTKRAMLEELGIEHICQRIESGESQSEIAESLGLAVSKLNEFINRPDHAERSARARQLSAEAWYDRGFNALVNADRDQAEIARARAIEQHCARRAAIRNPQYRDKQDVNATLSGGITVERIERVIVRPKHEAGDPNP